MARSNMTGRTRVRSAALLHGDSFGSSALNVDVQVMSGLPNGVAVIEARRLARVARRFVSAQASVKVGVGALHRTPRGAFVRGANR